MGVRSRVWLVELAAGVLAALMIGLPTVMFPSPFFVRMTPVRTPDCAIWLATAALLGPLIGTYVAAGAAGAPAGDERGRGRTLAARGRVSRV